MKNYLSIYMALAICLVVPPEATPATLKSETVKGWDTYVQLTEKRIAGELDGASGFLRADFVNPAEASRIRAVVNNNKVYVEKMTTTGADGREVRVADGLIHHWFGSIFVPKASLKSVLRWVQDYDQHQRYFKEVEQSKLVSREGDTFKIFLRFVRKKVVTVHYNTDHTVVYRDHQGGRESSRSFTTKIAELQSPGSPSEKEKPVGDDSGYFWRLNSYWRFQEKDDGVLIECESISLSRSIPFGLGWLIKGFVESVPRESLESTLTGIRDGVRAEAGNRLERVGIITAP